MWLRDERVEAFAALYPEGWAVAVAADDHEHGEELLDVLLTRAHERGEREIKLLVPTSRDGFLAFLRRSGFELDTRYATYRGPVTAAPMTKGLATVGAASGEADEREMFELIAREYHDLTDFDAWRAWITTWDKSPRLWFVARDGPELVGALVAFVLPWEGWIKRVALRDAQDLSHVGLPLIAAVMSEFASHGVKRVGLPFATGEPAYLPELASLAGLTIDDERHLMTRQIGGEAQ